MSFWKVNKTCVIPSIAKAIAFGTRTEECRNTCQEKVFVLIVLRNEKRDYNFFGLKCKKYYINKAFDYRNVFFLNSAIT